MKNLTAKVEFRKQDGEVLKMLFGNSYRKWDDQCDEFKRAHNLSVIGVETSDQPWISYGGLKWCHPTALQKELDREGKDRKVSDFIFAKLAHGDLSPYVL